MSKYITKTCPVCGEEFTTAYPKNNRACCGKECSYKLRGHRSAETQLFTYEQAVASFWARVVRTDNDDDCWLWTGGKNDRGYGSLRWMHKSACRANRVSYEIAHGKFPDELFVLHSCDNPQCVNPRHLFLGTAQDNADDMVKKDRQYRPVGELNRRAKLSDAQVIEVRNLYDAGGVTQQAIASMFGVERTTIGGIVRRQQRIKTID